jgi:HD-like signal output (HDOD) protein
MDATDKLRGLVERMGDLPTLPHVLTTINKLLSSPRTSAQDVGEAVSKDQVIAAKVLKLVNSAFYSFPGRISTITQAMVILGFSTVKNIVMTMSILNSFDMQKNIGGFSLMAFWRHSVATGALAQLIARETGFRGQEQTFIAGLLHDIGKLVLALYATNEFTRCLEYAEKRECLFYEAEKRLLGVTHAELGGWLNHTWRFPPDITAVLEHHHSLPSAAGEHAQIVAIVQFADILARSLQIGHPCDSSLPPLSGAAWELLKISSSQIDSVLENSRDAVDKASIFLTMEE